MSNAYGGTTRGVLRFRIYHKHHISIMWLDMEQIIRFIASNTSNPFSWAKTLFDVEFGGFLMRRVDTICNSFALFFYRFRIKPKWKCKDTSPRLDRTEH